MNKQMFALIGAVFASGAAMAAAQMPEGSQAAAPAPAASQAKQERSYYWWLHPKQGMVKVDRATNFPVIPQRQKKQG